MDPPARLGNYLLFPPFAEGATATVHLARFVRGDGFRRLLVIKQFRRNAHDQERTVDRMLREARLAARVRSPYVVPTVDVLATHFALVLEYVHGVSLVKLAALVARQGGVFEPAVAVAIMCNVLRALESAHEATGEDGRRLDLLHRDVAPQNVLVGSDGLARLLDFGIATAAVELRITATGEVRGTRGYLAPEQLRGSAVTLQADIFGAGAILWELLTGRALRKSELPEIIANLDTLPAKPSEVRPELPKSLDAPVMRALSVDPHRRFSSAAAMARELEAAIAPAPPHEVARFVERYGFDELDRMSDLVRQCEELEAGPVSADTVALSSSKPNARSRSMVTPGSIIAGKYRVEAELGRGGMGVVLAARHTSLNTVFAIKLLSRPGSTSLTERVMREARASMRLSSEHVVRVFDVGIDDGVPCLVMEKLEGSDLRTVLATEGRLSVADAATYALEVCEVLTEAHALGIVHRDLKPANLFVVQKPGGGTTIKVVDFGIAKLAATEGDAEDDGSLTDTGMLLGSPLYMSPEQLRSAKQVDPRTDLWALGVVLYEALAGKHPFAADQRGEVLARVMADEPPPLRDVRPDVPEGLAKAIHGCLRKDPEKRIQSAAALARALEPHAAGGDLAMARIRSIVPMPVDASPESESRPEPKSRSRAALPLVAAAGVAIVLTSMALPRSTRSQSAEPTAPAAVPTPLPSAMSSAVTPTASAPEPETSAPPGVPPSASPPSAPLASTMTAPKRRDVPVRRPAAAAIANAPPPTNEVAPAIAAPSALAVAPSASAARPAPRAVTDAGHDLSAEFE